MVEFAWTDELENNKASLLNWLLVINAVCKCFVVMAGIEVHLANGNFYEIRH